MEESFPLDEDDTEGWSPAVGSFPPDDDDVTVGGRGEGEISRPGGVTVMALEGGRAALSIERLLTGRGGAGIEPRANASILLLLAETSWVFSDPLWGRGRGFDESADTLLVVEVSGTSGEGLALEGVEFGGVEKPFQAGKDAGNEQI